jgi:uncharacterized protein (TIGR03790 family)
MRPACRLISRISGPRSPSRPKQAAAALLLALLLCLSLTAFPAWALSAEDLIVVYNRNMVESKAVAAYYAQKRQVPWDRLLGVAVPRGEQLTRREYEQNLLPPVRQAVKKVQAQGRAPALLLVYGIPLRVQGPPESEADRAFKDLAAAQLREYQGLVEQLLRELDALTGTPADLRPRPPGPLTYPTGLLLQKAQTSLKRALEFLSSRPQPGASAESREKALSLLLRLGGAALEVKISPEKGETGPEPLREGRLERDILRRELEAQLFRGVRPQEALKTAVTIRLVRGVLGELEFWENLNQVYQRPQRLAAVDSELTLALVPQHRLAGWLPNPLAARFDNFPGIDRVRQQTLMVGRLDGPDPEIARRLVDDALAAEAGGLKGVLYLDARGLMGDDKPGSYAWFDRHLLRLHDLAKENSGLKVVLDKNPGVFAAGSCPDAALYCGWYSLGKYVPAFKWVKGAVGYHVASSEAATLRQKGSNVWCKRLLEEGAAATLGPVAEPYLASFPRPDEFFPLLLRGDKPLLEVYFRTLPYVSWMQILIGDPLYIPFKKNPVVLSNSQ